MYVHRNYTDPPSTTPKTATSPTGNNPIPTSASNKAKNSKVIINGDVNNKTHTGPNKLGVGSKIVPVVSKSPINKTNMATGKPITPVKPVTTNRVVKSAGGGGGGKGGDGKANNNSSNISRGSSASSEKNDNKKNENIEKKKKEEKLRLKLEKEAKKVIYFHYLLELTTTVYF